MKAARVWPLLRVPLVFAVAAVLFAMFGARFLAERMLYYPEMGSRVRIEGVRTIPDANGNQIAVVHLPNERARSTLWFFHGNAEDLGDLEPFLLMLRQTGFSVFAFDYPGYGQSTGRPSEEALNVAARAAGKFLREELKVPAQQTILFGRSLGGGPAVQMAIEHAYAGLILQSTFTSVYRVMTRWRLLPSDLFDNERKLPRVGCPVLVIHGRRDEVIPFHHGEALLAAAPAPKRSLFIADAGHNDLIGVGGAHFWDALRQFGAFCEEHGKRP